MIDPKKFRDEHEQISRSLASEEILKNQEKYREAAKRFSLLEKIVKLDDKRRLFLSQKKEAENIIASESEDSAMKELAAEELKRLVENIAVLETEIENILFEDEYKNYRDIIVEIRAAAGGEEAALFSSVLFRMYSRYAETKGWSTEVLNSHPTEIGGFKEMIFAVKGDGCYSRLRFEVGVHRVQRVPVTEAGGRIHTSTVTVAVLVEPKEIEVKLNPEDLKIETFRASGCGGQHLNVTDSAVRIIHLPTGIITTCQSERSQLKNKEKAIRVLKARIVEERRKEEARKISQERKGQIGTGERSEKVRTYNFPERRVSDHRINFTIYRLDDILDGALDLVVKELISFEKKKKI